MVFNILMNEIFSIKEYVIGTIVLSLIHGSIPNHWLPFIAISKTEKWTFKQLFFVISLGAIFHSLSTALLGFFISYLGFYTSTIYQLEKILPTFFMIFLGMIYIILDHNNHHDHIKYKSKKLWISLVLLYLAMFFSPCLEIEAIYFSIGKYGYFSVILISILYTLITLFSMLFFSFISYKGLLKYYPRFIERNEKKIIGIVLIVLGIVSFYY